MDESRKIIEELKDRVLENKTDKKLKVGIFIGPEGGFSETEASELEKIGAKTMSLGHRILRTETAGLAIMSVLSFNLDI